MKTILLLILSIFFWVSTSAQSNYGYLGRKVYVAGDLAGSPAFISRKIDGDWGFGINVVGNLSLNFVLNKKQELEVFYKRYSGVASIHSQGLGIVWRQDYGWDLGEFNFSSNEYGMNYKFYLGTLGAPLGGYISLGFGIGVSKYSSSIQALNHNLNYNFSSEPSYFGYYSYGNYYGPGPTSPLSKLSFSESSKIYSPILRFGLGKQTVFGNRFFYNYGINVGINLAYLGQVFIQPLKAKDYDQIEITQTEFNQYAKMAVQNRVFGKNLLNFKMGIGILLF